LTFQRRDWRVPLTAINGALETMLSLLPANDPDAAKFLSVLQKNVRRINYLVSDLLLATRKPEIKISGFLVVIILRKWPVFLRPFS
jgi:signal transduction histidine kinase